MVDEVPERVEDAVAAEERRRQQEAAEEAAKFAAANKATAERLEALATRDVTDDMVADMVSAAADAPFNQYEMFSRDDASAQLTQYQNALTAALADISPADVTAGHTALLDAVLQLDLSGASAVDGVAAADRVMSQLLVAADPSQAGAVSDPGVKALAVEVKQITDTTFWYLLGTYFDGERLGPEESRKHLAFLRAAGDLKSLGGPLPGAKPGSDEKETFTWRTRDAKAFAVQQLLIAGVGSKTGVLPANAGGIDIAAMYRRAATLTPSLGKPIPRSVGAELLRLAVASVVGESAATGTPPEVEIGREPIARHLAMATLPAGWGGDVERMRSSAMGLLTATADVGAAKDKTLRDPFPLATRAVIDRAWLGSHLAQGEVLNYLATDLQNNLSANPDGKPLANGMKDLLAVSGLVEALNDWSTLRASSSASEAQLADAMEQIRKCTKMVLGGLGTLDDPNGMGLNATGVRAMRLLLDTMSVDVANQVLGYIKGDVAPDETRVGGARAVIDSVGLLSNYRLAAVSARDANGLESFTSVALKEYRSEKWFMDLRSAASAWDAANSSDLQGLSRAADTFKTALDTARGLQMTTDRSYYARVTADALAYAALDELTAAQALDLPLPKLDELVNGLQESLAQADIIRRLVPDGRKIANAWSRGKQGIKDLPPGLVLNMAGRLQAWQAAAWPQKGAPDLGRVAAAAFDVAAAVADYRRRIEVTPDSTTSDSSRATLLELLDAIDGSVSQRLVAIDA